MVVDNRWCLTEHGNDWSASVASQLDCQDMCLKNPSCVGISYSYRAGMRNTCFVCTTVRLSEVNYNSYGFAFYRTTEWFMTLPDPTNAQSAFVSVIVGAGAAWFGLYVGSTSKK